MVLPLFTPGRLPTIHPSTFEQRGLLPDGSRQTLRAFSRMKISSKFLLEKRDSFAILTDTESSNILQASVLWKIKRKKLQPQSFLHPSNPPSPPRQGPPPEEPIILNMIYPEAKQDLDALFPEPNMKKLLKEVLGNKQKNERSENG